MTIKEALLVFGVFILAIVAKTVELVREERRVKKLVSDALKESEKR